MCLVLISLISPNKKKPHDREQRRPNLHATCPANPPVERPTPQTRSRRAPRFRCRCSTVLKKANRYVRPTVQYSKIKNQTNSMTESVSQFFLFYSPLPSPYKVDLSLSLSLPVCLSVCICPLPPPLSLPPLKCSQFRTFVRSPFQFPNWLKSERKGRQCAVRTYRHSTSRLRFDTN